MKKILIALDNDLSSHKVANTSFSLTKYMDAQSNIAACNSRGRL